MITIGYQGIKGSNSEYAARQLAKKQGIDKALFLPLVSSFNVLDSVHNNTVDYGVVAFQNSTGGKVKESVQTLKYLNVKFVDSITIPIYHDLFVKDKHVKKDQIKTIASHSQAIVQCKKNLSELFPNTTLLADEDTATAARKLAIGLFDESVAVLCRGEAGIMNHLHLFKSHLEDFDDNTTEFKIFCKD